MTTLNDIIRRRTANKYAGTKLGTQIANEYETGSRAGQNLLGYQKPRAAAIIGYSY
jgi:hypothetical protein